MGVRLLRLTCRAADRIVHTIGNFAGVVGAAMLVGIASGAAERPVFFASLVYSICLLTMLGCSAAYTSPPMDPEKRSSASSIMPRSF
jgi:predicted membrane channel-forming protein YqfA (hemolysin III family)